MSKTTSELYECRDCQGLTAATPPDCPYCGNSEGPEKTVVDMDNPEETFTTNRPWWRVVDLEADNE